MKSVVGLAGLCLALIAVAAPARANLTWTWNYSGSGVSASGLFTTADTPDSGGFYQVTGINGQRNGISITGLQPTGTPIPGNEPFAVDNLISASSPQLTANGFGYALADGSHANPFWADFLPIPGYLEFYSAPAAGVGLAPAETIERPISFQTALIPEPASIAILAVSCAAFGLAQSRGRPASGRL